MWIYESNRGRAVSEILNETNEIHQQILAVIDSLPDDVRIERIEPKYYVVWVNEIRFAPGEFFDHFYDDHEPDLRAWLARVAKQ